MPEHYKILFRLPMDSGVPNDAVINTWHVEVEDLSTGLTDAIAALDDFYGDVSSVFSQNVDFANATFTAYKMSDPEPRAPTAVVASTPHTSGTTALPSELAICLSFQGSRISGTSQARRRGRVYLGPLMNVQNTTTSTVILNSTVDQIRDAAATLLAASDADADWRWCVYSTVNDALVTVSNGWVDNAFDIQRRRGITATQRLTF